MKTIKPISLSVMSRVVEFGGQFHFTVTGMILVALDAPDDPLPELDLWKTIAKELGQGVPFDEVMPKSRGEVLLTGSAFAPGGVPTVACNVRAALGTVDKTLRVVGDRVWDRSGASSGASPFTEMPLTWARAFGGDGFAQNPLGRGATAVQTPSGTTRPLPNVEDPRFLVRTPDDRPAPAGFGPLDCTWPQRASKLGTYDTRWLREDFPGLPRDIDWTAFNAAPEDQQTEGFFRGDEGFLLENLHPEHSRIDGRLPGLAMRAFVNRRLDEGESLHEVLMRLDTVHFLPRAMRAVLLYRGVVTVSEDDAADVLQLLLACERVGEPKEEAHYRTVLAQRLDPEKGIRYAFRERDLMPAGVRSGFKTLDAADESPKPEGLLGANMRRRAEGELAKSREMLTARGIDPDKHLPRVLPPPEPEPPLEDLPEVIEGLMAMAESKKLEAMTARAEAEARAKALCEKHGVDFDAVVARAKAGSAGPPRSSVEAQIRGARALLEKARAEGIDVRAAEAKFADPRLSEKLAMAQAAMLRAYKMTAHHQEAAQRAAVERSAQVREAVQARVAAGESLATCDLTGVDLSGMHLSGADFRDALMECVNLRGSQLAGANFSGAVLARADLSNAVLSGARFKGANLGAAVLRDARADEAIDLTGATLWGTDLSGAALRGATLADALVYEVVLRGADLSGLRARDAKFFKCDLASAKLHEAELLGALFMECTAAGVDFTGARMKGATFVKTQGDGAIFRGVDAENLRVVLESSFAGADFQEARMPRSSLRGAYLASAKFSKSELDATDFSECDLTGAQFFKASAGEARFVRANLTDAVMVSAGLLGAILQKANLQGADFTGAVLFGADMARTRGKPRSLEGANLGRVRVVARVPNG